MASFFDFLTGNSTNLARSAGAPMAANMPHNVMSRGMASPYQQLRMKSGFNGAIGMPQAATPMLPMGSRFPRIQSLAQRIGQLVNDPLKVGLIASSFGSRPDEMLQVVSRYENERAKREMIRRQFEEIDQKKRESEQISEYIKSLAKPQGEGQPPLLSATQADFLSRAAQTDPQAAMGMLARVPGLLAPEAQPELSDTGAKIRDIEAGLGRKLTERERLTLAGGGELFKAQEADDDELDKILSTSDLESYRLPDGSKLPPGSTLRDAKDNGALPYTAAEITQQRAAESADVTLDELEKLSIGDGGVHIGAGGGAVTNMWPGRVMHGAANATGTFFGTEASRNRDLYNRMREAFIASIARSRGESGSLSDSDIARIVGALPDLGATPMTEEQAKEQWAIVRKIYGAANKKPGGARASSGGSGVRFLGYE